MKTAIVGVGNLGSVIARRLLASGTEPGALVLLTRGSESSRARCRALRMEPGDSSQLAGTELVIIAVKPQDALETCRTLQGKIPKAATVVSVMAGVCCKTLRVALSHDVIARVMPNLGAAVGESASAYFVSDDAGEEALTRVQRVVLALGKAWRVRAEESLDVATAVAGSGPAYLCWLGECVESVARQYGFSEEDAHAIVLQTFKGAVSYLEHNGETFSSLRERVTSPRGTTAEALAVLEGARARSIAREAIEAALRRARELGATSRE